MEENEELAKKTPLMEKNGFQEPPLMESQASKNTFGESLGSSNPMKGFKSNTIEVFISRDAVIEWCQDTEKQHNTVIVRGKGRNKVGRKGSYIEFQCERSGVYYSHYKKEIGPKSNEKLDTDAKRKKKRETGRKKCGCPFKVRSICMEGNRWNITVKCGFHNHPIPNTLTGHAFAGRLTKKEEEQVISLTLAGVNPKKILFALKINNPENHSTMRTIYNFRAKLRLEEMEGRSVMQHMENLLQKYYYAEWHRKGHDEVVLDILWSHPEATLLARCFSHLLTVDSTYNTNRFKMPLFHAVGVTSKGKTFTVSFAFMKRETEEHYTWAMRHVKALYSENYPSVIITDGDLALIKSVGIVFPEATHMLCTWHVGKNVQGRCTFENNPNSWLKFNCDWRAVWTAETVDAYNKAYAGFVKNGGTLKRTMSHTQPIIG